MCQGLCLESVWCPRSPSRTRCEYVPVRSDISSMKCTVREDGAGTKLASVAPKVRRRRSPDEAERNPGKACATTIPHFAALHAGYGKWATSGYCRGEFGAGVHLPRTVRFMDGVHLLLQCVHSRHPWRSNARAYMDVFTACSREVHPSAKRVQNSGGEVLLENPQLTPHSIHPFLHALVHDNRAAPFACGFAGPFVGGIEADL